MADWHASSINNLCSLLLLFKVVICLCVCGTPKVMAHLSSIAFEAFRHSTNNRQQRLSITID